MVPTETSQQKLSVGEGKILPCTSGPEFMVLRKPDRQRGTVKQSLAIPRCSDTNQTTRKGQERSQSIRSKVGRLLRTTRSNVSLGLGASRGMASQTLVSATWVVSCLPAQNYQADGVAGFVPYTPQTWRFRWSIQSCVAAPGVPGRATSPDIRLMPRLA